MFSFFCEVINIIYFTFQLRITVGRAAVRSARSIRLVTEVDLLSSTDYAQPLLVIGNGRTYTVSDNSPKKAIMGVIQKCAMEKKARGSQGSFCFNSKVTIFFLMFDNCLQLTVYEVKITSLFKLVI